MKREHYISIAGAEIAAMTLYYMESANAGRPWDMISEADRADYRRRIRQTMAEAIAERQAEE